MLAWTTTPWTLPSNVALCVHPDLNYVKIKGYHIELDSLIVFLASNRVL